MTNKEILESCRETVLKLHELDNYVARLKISGQPAGVRTQQFGAVSPGTNDPVSAAIQLYDGLLTQQEELRAAYIQLAEQAKQIILSLSNTREAIILMRYYIEGLSDLDISQALHLSREYINKLRNNGIKRI